MNPKVIVVGIDGGDLEIFKRFELPVFKSLMKRGYSKALQNQKLYRGWATILTGKTGDEHGGLHTKPVVGSYRTTCVPEGK